MIRVMVLEMLDKDERNTSWLANKTGINYSTLYNFIHQNTNMVNYEVLNKLCEFFNCSVGSIIEYKKDTNEVEDTKVEKTYQTKTSILNKQV